MKKCLECNELIFGREDKKFCCDGCRNSFNNRINKDTTNLMRNINNKLRKNYRILSELNPNARVTIKKTKLINKGFDFDLYTTQHRTKSGNLFNFVYNQGYFSPNQHQFILIKKDFTH